MIPGELRQRMERYVSLRRALGFAMRAEERLLRAYVEFVAERDLAGPLRAQWALDWACATAERCGPAGRARRLSVARGFLAHLRAACPDTEVPAHGLLAGAIRPNPYIYSDTEIEMLVGAARRLGPPDSLRPHTIATLIGLVASSGLRAGEAIRLRAEDVDLDGDPPRLAILQTKFRKSRLVPVHPSTAAALRTYASTRQRLGHDKRGNMFFVSDRPGPLNYQAVARTFVKLARLLGLRGAAGDGGASLHDLRHTFATRRLVKWHREGSDVSARMPELSVYLGHVRPVETYWYLTATPELLSAAASRFASYVNIGGTP